MQIELTNREPRTSSEAGACYFAFMFRRAPRRTAVIRSAPLRISAGDLKKRSQTRPKIGQPQARPWDVDVRAVISQNVDGFGRTSGCILVHPRASGCILAHHQMESGQTNPNLPHGKALPDQYA